MSGFLLLTKAGVTQGSHVLGIIHGTYTAFFLMRQLVEHDAQMSLMLSLLAVWGIQDLWEPVARELLLDWHYS